MIIYRIRVVLVLVLLIVGAVNVQVLHAAPYVEKILYDSTGAISDRYFLKNAGNAAAKVTAQIGARTIPSAVRATVALTKGNVIVGAVALLGGIAYEMWGDPAVQGIRNTLSQAGIARDANGYNQLGPDTYQPNPESCYGEQIPSQFQSGATVYPIYGHYAKGNPEYANAQAAAQAFCASQPYCAQSAYQSYSACVGWIPVVYGPQYPGWAQYAFPYDRSVAGDGIQVIPGTPVSITLQQLKEAIEAGVEAGNQATTDAIKEATSLLNRGINDSLKPDESGKNQPASQQPTTSAKIVNTPSDGSTIPGDSPKEEREKQIIVQLPPGSIPDDEQVGDVTVIGGGASPAPDPRAVHDPPYTGSFELPEWPEVASFSERFQSFKTQMMTTGLFSVPSAFIQGAGSGGDPITSVDAGVWGTHTFNFGSFGGALVVVRACLLLLCGWAAVRIVILKG